MSDLASFCNVHFLLICFYTVSNQKLDGQNIHCSWVQEDVYTQSYFETSVLCVQGSGGFRNLEGVSATGVRSASENVGYHAHFRSRKCVQLELEVWTEYFEATLGLDKRLEISNELIRECVTVLGCCCMPLLYTCNHLMDSRKYVPKNRGEQWKAAVWLI